MWGKISFVIVGCGAIGKRHASIIHEHFVLKAVCDSEFDKAEGLASLYDCKAYCSVQQMLENELQVDVAVICTPNGLHAIHSILALKAGLHVLCEKPMALTVEDCNLMIDVSKSCNKEVLIVKQNRFNPPVLAVKDLIDNNTLGLITGFQVNGFWNRGNEYYQNSWKGTKSLDGGILFTQFSHFIDIIYWFLGEIDVIDAVAGNYLHKNSTEIEDSLCAMVKTSYGAYGTLHFNVNTYKKNAEGSITLFGENGTVKIGGEYLNEISYWQVQGVDQPTLHQGNSANQYQGYQGSMNNHALVYNHMIEVLQNKAAPSPNLNDAMKTVQIITSIYNKLEA